MLLLYVKLQNWWSRQEGATMVEYAVIAAVIVVGLMATLGSLRTELVNMFTKVINQLKDPTKPGA